MTIPGHPAIRAVLVDLDNTIYPYTETSRHVRQRLAQHISTLTGIATETVLKTYGEIADQSGGTIFSSGHDMRRNRLAALGQQLGTSFDVDATARLLDAQLLDHAEIYPGVDAVLETLERHYRILIMTEGYGDTQRRVLEKLGLSRFTLFATFQHAVRKSDGSAYKAVAQQLDIDCGRSVVIGDHWRNDVLAAAECNATTVWISNGRPLPGPPPTRFLGACVALSLVLPLLGLSPHAAHG